MLKRRTFLLGSASALAVSRAASQVPGGEATVGGEIAWVEAEGFGLRRIA